MYACWMSAEIFPNHIKRSGSFFECSVFAFSQLVSETRSALAEKSKSLNSCNSNNETSGFFLLGSKFTRPLAFIYGERHFLHI